MRKLTCSLLLLALIPAMPATADVGEAIKAAMEAPDRPEADKARDRNRKPVETLAFFGLKEDMRVLELLPGGGWYTRLLAPALREKGKLYVAIGTQRIEGSLLKQPGFEDVAVAPMSGESRREEGARRFGIADLSFDVEDIDLVLTFRNVHNFDPAGRKAMHEASLAVLKPGGHYGVVDHTRRHMDDDNSETWRRMDPVQVIKEVQAAGFEFVDYSDLHFCPDDQLIYEVGRKSVTGNTDRFTLLFKKPE